jgi:ABC-type sugar transport system permease subunit
MFLCIISTIQCFQAFTQFNVLIGNEGPNNATNVMVYALFTAFWKDNRYGFASALAVVLFVILLLLTILQYRVLTAGCIINSAQASPAYRDYTGVPGLPLAKKAGTYFLLVLASGLVLFPLLFAFSLALQGETIAPTLIPDVSKLDFSVFAQAFSKEKHLSRWILNSFVVSVAVTLGQLLTSVLAATPFHT